VQSIQPSASTAGNSGKLQKENSASIPHLQEQARSGGSITGGENADESSHTSGVSIKCFDRRGSATLQKASYRGSPVTDVRLATEVNDTTVSALRSIGPRDFQAVREIGQGAFGKVWSTSVDGSNVSSSADLHPRIASRCGACELTAGILQRRGMRVGLAVFNFPT
jgi:hypothetical protein